MTLREQDQVRIGCVVGNACAVRIDPARRDPAVSVCMTTRVEFRCWRGRPSEQSPGIPPYDAAQGAQLGLSHRVAWQFDGTALVTNCVGLARPYWTTAVMISTADRRCQARRRPGGWRLSAIVIKGVSRRAVEHTRDNETPYRARELAVVTGIHLRGLRRRRQASASRDSLKSMARSVWFDRSARTALTSLTYPSGPISVTAA